MNIYKTLLGVFTALCLFIPIFLYSQVDTAWVRIYNGPGNSNDYANSFTVDEQGNVYVTGYSCSGSTATTRDYATIKYNSAGVEQWVQRYNGSGDGVDNAKAIVVDGQGNVYVTGYSYGSGTGDDYATIKYNSAGVEQWVQRYNGPGNGGDYAYALALDGQGNVYVTGVSWGLGTYNDYATIKYNSAGVEQWAVRYNGPGNAHDGAYSLTVDGQSNIYVTGYSSGLGTYYDYATIKYDSNGDTLWVRSYNSPGNGADQANAIAVDGQGNVYVTGYGYGSTTYYDYVTIKYNSAGVEQWVQRYNGPGNGSDYAYALAVDESGNVYVTGGSAGIGTADDYATVKYNSAGIQQWVQRYNGPGNDFDVANAIAVDGSGNIYVTGSCYCGSGTVDDYATIKYNALGIEQWVQMYNGLGNHTDIANSLAVGGSGNIYVTGVCTGSGTGSDYATIKYVQTGAIEENENYKLKTDNFSVFPNPASSFFNISSSLFALNYTLKLYDVTGKVVKHIGDCRADARNDNTVRVSLDGIKNGVYFVQVGDKTVTKKLVVTK